jgi:uncharacterized membrane protein YdjX (TVP38/TMEM64 family)
VEHRETFVYGTKHRIFFWILLVAVAIAVPIVPFLLFGESAELQMSRWLDVSDSPKMAAALVVGLLAGDIFLPVPSSLVSTFAGKALGFWLGTVASWCGMTIGTSAAYWLVRWLGRPLARRFSSEEELARMDELANRHGLLILILARPVPVLAEASVLVIGTTQIGWWRFFAAVSLSNLGIAAGYAILGDRVQLPFAIAAAYVVPVVVTLVARWLLPRNA